MDPLLSAGVAAATIVLLFAYLFRLNNIISQTPDEIAKLSPTRWTSAQLRETYRKLESNPMTTKSYAHRIPPKLERRYIVTGGSGLVGGYIVLQLLERGQPPESIRIVDFRPLNRRDMIGSPAATVDFVQTDISSEVSTERAFSKSWHPSVAHLPLTVFHTAAVIVPSERSKLVYGFCESVNVSGTQHVVEAAQRAGADVFISTTSGSISIRRIEFWPAPWRLLAKSGWRPKNFSQVLDEADFFKPIRAHDDFYANYPASKASAERIVCAANADGFRTGCIRPANGVYGNPTDNTVGGPLNRGDLPTWVSHVIQSFVHGINAAIAHLHFEAVLARPGCSASAPQAGRPFVVTDPNPPITYGDLYYAIKTLAVTHFRTITIPPVIILLVCHVIEWYTLLRVKYPVFCTMLPPITGDAKFLEPGLMDICTHLVASNAAVGRTVEAGGLAYTGVVTTLEGMVQEVMEWNHEHEEADAKGTKVAYHVSISLPEQLQKAGAGMASLRAAGSS
ncbi:hypothetical protein B0H66DRAFT_73640 [Apodospora peruviana]|uniref:3-beta hydroxysteroid dehydrogenase/isomerase domain-containing protein n=1 Tax=Apodospora peruviana TaxID=516989 RepID=A0AAE0IT32_9PEZI|nr:hypothetical protein B0H66DRAFT_73640 [Apodospora peruviana]